LLHLHNFQQHFSVLVEQRFVVDVDKAKIVVGEKFQLPEIVLDLGFGGVAFLLNCPDAYSD